MSERTLSPTWSLHDLKRVPGLLSLSRLALAALFPIVVGERWWALGVLAVAGATDVLDGWYARRFHEESPTGAVLDGVADKVFILSVVITLLVIGEVTFVQLLLLGTRDLGELAIACRMHFRARHLLGTSANVAGKVATLFQYAAIVAVVLASSYSAALIWGAAASGIVAFLSYWRRDVATPGP